MIKKEIEVDGNDGQMSESKQVKQTKHTPGPLPEGWTLKGGLLTDHEGVERYVLDGNGRIDRMKVSIILDNYGFGFHSRAWVMTPLEAAAPELLESLYELTTAAQYCRENGGDVLTSCSWTKAEKAIAKAEGRS